MSIYDFIAKAKKGLREEMDEIKADRAASKIAKKQSRAAYRQEYAKASQAQAKAKARAKVKQGGFLKGLGNQIKKNLKEKKERNKKNGLYDFKSPFE